MKKSILTISVAAVFASLNAGAATLPSGAVMSIDAPSKFNMGSATPYDNACTALSPQDVDLVGQKGLYVGASMGDISSGSHGGVPTGSDRGAVTEMWNFFGNTGVNFMSQTVGIGSFSGDTTPAVGADMSSWIVSWNGIQTIPMGGCEFGANWTGTGMEPPGSHPPCDTDGDDVDDLDDSAPSSLVCGSDCSIGDTYVISHSAHVPSHDASGFGGVPYNVCLTGTIQAPPASNTAPVATNDSYIVATDATGVVLGTQLQPLLPGVVLNSIARNDFDNDSNDGQDLNTIDMDPGTLGIQTTVPTSLGGIATVGLHAADPSVVIYDTPGLGIVGTDTFTYSIADIRSGTRSTASVSIAVGNVAPVANNDTGFVDLTIPETFDDIDVLANDTDLNGNGTIDSTTIDLDPATAGQQLSITTPHGVAADQGGGIIRYTPTPGYLGADTFTYTVMDIDASPLTSNEATVVVKVSQAGLPIGPFLVLNPGQVSSASIAPALGEGSWFSMEVNPGNLTYTAVVGFNHIELYTAQPALSPNIPNIDSPWFFFGNWGVHQTTDVLNQLSNDNSGSVLLDFSVWNVSWNAIPSITLGSGQDNGVATLKCYTDLIAGTLGTCATGEQFLLTYRAIVPPGDVSGFGGVNYTVHFEGTVSDTPPRVGCLNESTPFTVDVHAAIDNCSSKAPVVITPGVIAASKGNTTGLYLTAADIDKKDPSINPDDGQQCIGGCLDFIADNLTNGEVDLVVKLNAPIPAGASYRKLINNRWRDFDTSTGDDIGSAAADPTTGKCQGPEGVFRIGLREGYECLYLKITDGGPNDADGVVNGTIVDPGGIALSGSPNVPASSTNGCSISNVPVNIAERVDWMIVAGFIALMGLVSFKRKSDNS
jgi:hypothetical protein